MANNYPKIQETILPNSTKVVSYLRVSTVLHGSSKTQRGVQDIRTASVEMFLQHLLSDT